MEWEYGESPSCLNTAMADFKITFTITIKYVIFQTCQEVKYKVRVSVNIYKDYFESLSQNIWFH